jgi:uncharacterized protein YcbX
MPGAHVSHGSVTALWRYPVKSMRGEELDSTELTGRGLVGDRAYALVDPETGKIASAKNPRKWPSMFQFRAAYITPPKRSGPRAPVRVTFPDGTVAATDDPEIERLLSEQIGKPVQLAAAPPELSHIEGYWPDYDWLETPDAVFEMPLTAGTFFDAAPVHLVTTATLAQLASLAPHTQFDIRRFRPNFVVEVSKPAGGFVENDWVGRTLRIGSEVRLGITGPCARCVMTTLGQDELPKDPTVLRAIVEHNLGNVGALASVTHGGSVRRGDHIVLE